VSNHQLQQVVGMAVELVVEMAEVEVVLQTSVLEEQH
jgi:hypothetical protein